MTDTPIAEMTFEQAMVELEKVVSALERGDVALDQSITLYERGAELKKRCEAKLKEAEEVGDKMQQKVAKYKSLYNQIVKSLE